MLNFLPNLAYFAAYFSLSIAAILVFKVVYSAFTPFDEFAEVKEKLNTAAGISIAGALIGFSVALSGAISNSINLLDFGLWAVVALCAQMLAYTIVRVLLLPKIVSRIQKGEVSAAIVLASVNIAVGLVNAACMTY